MSIRSSSSSSSRAAAPVPAPAALKAITGWIDSCTYIKQKDLQNQYGCYLFRSCQSCLETNGCMVNDLGICVSQDQGMKNLATGGYQSSTSYYSEMNYLKAIDKNLTLPKAVTSNKAALSADQNWHFRAGDATYCKADDSVCKECKTNNFWRGANDTSLPDSRFCVGQSGCVCIQTCEVPTYKTPGCQWKLSAPSPSYNGPCYGGGGYYDNYRNYGQTVTHLAYWEWLVVLLVTIAVHFLFQCCSGSSTRQLQAAREEAVRAVRRELGIPEDEPLTAPVRTATVTRAPRRTETILTEESSDHGSDAEEVKTPRHGEAAQESDPQTVFVEMSDRRPAPSPRHQQAATRTEM